jgi:hypothetical protein
VVSTSGVGASYIRILRSDSAVFASRQFVTLIFGEESPRAALSLGASSLAPMKSGTRRGVFGEERHHAGAHRLGPVINTKPRLAKPTAVAAQICDVTIMPLAIRVRDRAMERGIGVKGGL